ncbi:MAG: glycosyltransferase family 2 protein [Eubacterium sp.]|nr:glycosyltransferase family 2 protein [Eubacterium sp.]
MSKTMAIVLNYNSFDDTVKCIKFLKKQNTNDLEICVIDNCSSDGRVSDLEDACNEEGIMFVANKENFGYSAGNNIGLKKAVEENCKYALIINPDVEIRDGDYVAKAVAKMDEDNDIVALGTDIIISDRGHQNPMRESKYWEELFWPLNIIRNKVKPTMPFIGDYSKDGYSEKLSGCCFFVRLDFMQQINYFDETVFLYSEEAIFSAQVKKAEKKMYYKSDLTAYHMHRKSEKERDEETIHIFFQSRKYYLNTYSGLGKVKLRMLNKSLTLQEKMLVRKYRKNK